MSYDMSIGDEHFNYTYNVAPMWYDCYKKKGIRKIYGKTGKKAAKTLAKLIIHMNKHNCRLRKMNPENGWGSFEGALMFAEGLFHASLRNKKKVWRGD